VSTKTIYWVGWARIVGSQEWREVVHVYQDDPGWGWLWLKKNWRPEDIDAHSLCILRKGEHPMGRNR
jgi:hypothetical protein